jgi:probable selenium-dependent hydroxylase accessory protein YqeC
MRLVEALGVTGDDVVALVGGGGKTSAMFRLAREIVDKGDSVITTTTARIFAAQIALAPSHVPAADATRERVAAALAEHRHTLVIGATNPRDGKADGISLELFTSLRRWFPGVVIVNEADGSRMRAFKAPAAHEPVIPAETTLVVPVVGADVLGKTLDAESVHRPELVSALSGAPLSATITPDIVGRVLAHRDGGLKGVPPGARVVVIINKVETLPDRGPAHETAKRLLRARTIASVVLAAVRAEPPVLEVLTG